MFERSEVYRRVVDLESENDSASILIGYMRDRRSPDVLDVGCACGDFGLAVRKSIGADVRMCGLELDVRSAEIARESGAYERVVQCDLDALTPEDYPEFRSRFDFLICGDVLEHLRNPAKTLSDLLAFLKPDGEIFASIPNVAHMSVKANLLENDFTYTPVGLLDCTHVHLFTYRSIASLFSAVGLEVRDCHVTTVSQFGWQPGNPYEDLPIGIRKYLYEDAHSHVCQYVVSARRSFEDEGKIRDVNMEALDAIRKDAPGSISKYRDELLASLPATEEDRLRIDRDRLSAECVSLAGQRDELAKAREGLRAELDATVGDRDRLSAECVSLAGQRDELAKACEGLRAELDATVRALTGMKRSVSWRITAPLRWCVRRF